MQQVFPENNQLMARAQNPLTGQMSGTVANFVTSSLNGENLIRSKAFNPRDANSVAQQYQRAAFKMISDEYLSWGGIPSEGFPELNAGQSAYTQFMALNLKTAIDKSGSLPVIDYSKLWLSNGSLPALFVQDFECTADGILINYRTYTQVPLVNGNDQVVMVAKTQEGELFFVKQERGEEKLGNILLSYPGIRTTDIKCCYVYVLNAEGSKASRSTYVRMG